MRRLYLIAVEVADAQDLWNPGKRVGQRFRLNFEFELIVPGQPLQFSCDIQPFSVGSINGLEDAQVGALGHERKQ